MKTWNILAVPDIQVENPESDKAQGQDTQLRKAVDVLLQQLGGK
ncbi:MAG: hypothetical protein R2795_21485 [Saprospiraceae bacterium]